MTTHEVDHIRADSHGGETVESNLALSCYACNHFKGTNLSGIDPQTDRITRLFHPRKDRWAAHFEWDGPELVGKTAVGRATVGTLHINDDDFVRLRESLMAEGLFPP